jgi:DNA-binding FadR family transcriptional regulator
LELVERYQFSLTQFREALKRPRSEGFVHAIPRFGCFSQEQVDVAGNDDSKQVVQLILGWYTVTALIVTFT